VGVCVLKTLKLKQLKWMWVPAVCAALLSGCNDSSGGSTAAQSGAAAGSTSTTPVNRSAALSWEAPTTNTNGSALTDLAGYRIYYGSTSDDLKQSVQITNVSTLTYIVNDLTPGTWYFAVMAVTSTGSESALSNVVSKTIG
jgi:Fibronectin type III domain